MKKITFVLIWILLLLISCGKINSKNDVLEGLKNMNNQGIDTTNGVESSNADEESNSQPASKSNDGLTSVNENLDVDVFVGIDVDSDDLSGDRETNVVVDIGFGDREYYAFTNEYGQLFRVIADEIFIRNDAPDQEEAKVSGVELKRLDAIRVIPMSLGGVSNAYNITPQNITINQAFLEEIIKDAGGCTDFEVNITYPNNETQIPSHYSFTFYIDGIVMNYEFDNVTSE